MVSAKVFFLQEIIPSYRVPVFRRLAELEGVDLTVFYSDASRVQQKENLKSTDAIISFRHVNLRKIFHDDELATYLGGNARRSALQRHDPVLIIGQLESAYAAVLSDVTSAAS